MPIVCAKVPSLICIRRCFQKVPHKIQICYFSSLHCISVPVKFKFYWLIYLWNIKVLLPSDTDRTSKGIKTLSLVSALTDLILKFFPQGGTDEQCSCRLTPYPPREPALRKSFIPTTNEYKNGGDSYLVKLRSCLNPRSSLWSCWYRSVSQRVSNC